jgi:acetyltransferase-like isoleucine patch superfamily enzyme
MDTFESMNESTKVLWQELKELQKALSCYTKKKYNRINPFNEDLFNWKERGAYWLGEDKDVTLYNSTFVTGDVSIGENSWIGPFCTLDGTGGLSIGSFCSISLGCQLLTHDTVKWALSGGKAEYEYASTKIGSYCFLGSYVVVLKGVTVGDHCLIGAGAVVDKDMPDNSIAVGVPAQRIGKVEITRKGEVKLIFNK